MFSFVNAAIADFGFIAIWCIIFQNGICLHLSQSLYFITTLYVHHNCVILVLSKLAQIIVLFLLYWEVPNSNLSHYTIYTLWGVFHGFLKFLQTNAGIVPQLGHVCVLHLFSFARHQSSCHFNAIYSEIQAAL